jgi:hypothetical protein
MSRPAVRAALATPRGGEIEVDKRTLGAMSIVLVAVLSSCGGYAVPSQTPAPEVQETPSAGLAPAVPDFAMLGFPDVLANQDIALGQSATITGGAFTVDIPANAFDAAVGFEILTGPLDNFEAKAPATVIPVLAVAFRVTDLQTGELVGIFDQPVMLIASSPDIVEESGYYDIMPDGTYVADPTGMQVTADELRHPLNGATVGWVITVPEPVIK